jgi:UDP-N-acetylglucosamine 2-epimerase (non-hydrolysing)
MPLKIISVVQSRSGLIKVAAIREAIQTLNQLSDVGLVSHALVHIKEPISSDGCDIYFNDIDLPKPDVFLGVSSPAGPNTTTIQERFSEVLFKESPAVVMITGDSDSALDCALVTKRIGYERSRRGKGCIPALGVLQPGGSNVAQTASRQVNSVVLGLLADYLFTSEENATLSLLHKGVGRETMHFVGSFRIDTLLRHRTRAMQSTILSDLQLISGSRVRPFVLLALQHLSGAEGVSKLRRFRQALFEIARQMPMVLPASPAVLRCIHEASLEDYFVDHFVNGPEAWDARVRIRLIPQLGYLDFVKLMATAKIALTDSAGIQEQTAVLGVPSIVLTDVAAVLGTFDGTAKARRATDSERTLKAFYASTSSGADGGPLCSLPPPWDGRAAQRAIEILLKDFALGRVGAKPFGAMPLLAG